MKQKRKQYDWQSINDNVGFIQHKKNRFTKKKLISLVSVLALGTAGTATGMYYFIFSMTNALNFSNFKVPNFDFDKTDFQVNMGQIPITNSHKSLRLEYFKDILHKKVFKYLSNLSWWKMFMSHDINDFDFYWYQSKTDIPITVNNIQGDGFKDLDVVLKIKESDISFRSDLKAYVYNTAQFYENFMKFNNFESYSANQDDSNQILHKGYLSAAYSVKKNDTPAPYNARVYHWINGRIATFMRNESQELDGRSKLYPILTSISNLQDINVLQPDTLQPYVDLVLNPHATYYDQGAKYQQLKADSKFYIIYSPIPDLIDQLINKRIDTVDKLITFLTNLTFDYIPFVTTDQSLDEFGMSTNYAPQHQIITPASDAAKEVTNYFYYASNTINIENFNLVLAVSDNQRISDLNYNLTKKIWNDLYQQLLLNHDAVQLAFPESDPEINFAMITHDIDNFKIYFKNMFNVEDADSLIKISYYNKNNLNLNVRESDKIDTGLIKRIRINIGPKQVPPNLWGNPRAFSFNFKVLWN